MLYYAELWNGNISIFETLYSGNSRQHLEGKIKDSYYSSVADVKIKYFAYVDNKKTQIN